MWKFLCALLGGRGSGFKLSSWIVPRGAGPVSTRPTPVVPARPAAAPCSKIILKYSPLATAGTWGGSPCPRPGLCRGSQPRKIHGNVFPFLLVFLSCSCLAQLEWEKVVFSPLSASGRAVPISVQSCSCINHNFKFRCPFPTATGVI